MKNQKSNSNQILQELLRCPYEFWKVLHKKENGSRKNIAEKVRNSFFRKLFQNLSNEDIMNIYKNFEKEIKIIRDWILNSNNRAKTFYYFGKLGSITASEIADEIDKHAKSVSIYIKEFSDIDWLELVQDDDKRTKRYTLSEIGLSYYNLAEKRIWFDFIREDDLPIEQTVLKIDYILVTVLDDDKTLDWFEDSIPYKEFPEIEILINEIEKIANKMIKKLNLKIKVPNLRELNLGFEGCRNLLYINSIDEVELAIIFASFNYIRKNICFISNLYGPDEEGPTKTMPFISKIKSIKINDYFDEDLSYFEDDQDFLSEEETKNFISKTLKNFKYKTG